MFLTCYKKECNFFMWIDQPISHGIKERLSYSPQTLKCVTTGLPVWEVLTSFMGFDTENGYMKYGNRASFMSEKLKKTLETTQMLHFV